MEAPSPKKAKTASVPRRYELLRAAGGFKKLGTPGGQGGVFEGKTVADALKAVAVKVFFVGQEAAATKESAMLVAANAGDGHPNILGLVEADPRIQVSENLGTIMNSGKVYTYSHDAIVLPKAGGGAFLEYAIELLSSGTSTSIDLLTPTHRETARGFFAQMVAGVARLHELGIVHLDLKLENMLIDAKHEHATLMISDFGLSEKVASTGRLGFQVTRGSENYAPPEVLVPARRAADTNGFAVDVWTLGVCLAVLVIGIEIFKDENHTLSKTEVFEEMQAAQAAGKNGLREACSVSAYSMLALKRFEDLPPTLQSLLDSMLRVDPQERPTLSQVAASPWVAGTPEPVATGAPPPGVVVPLPPGTAAPPAVDSTATYRSAANLGEEEAPRYNALSALPDSAAGGVGYRGLSAADSSIESRFQSLGAAGIDMPRPPPIGRCNARTLV